MKPRASYLSSVALKIALHLYLRCLVLVLVPKISDNGASSRLLLSTTCDINP